jgi:hypothetical protein
MKTEPPPAAPASPLSADSAVLGARLDVLTLLLDLAVAGAQRMGAIIRQAADLAERLYAEGLAAGPSGRLPKPKARFLDRAGAATGRLIRVMRVAHWCIILSAWLQANPRLCARWANGGANGGANRGDNPPASPPSRPSSARREPRRAEKPAGTPVAAAVAGLTAPLRGIVSLLPKMLPHAILRAEARALQRALDRHGFAGLIARFCRELGIDPAPYAALFAEPLAPRMPAAEIVPMVLSVRDWLARVVAGEQAAVAPLATAAEHVPAPGIFANAPA